MTEQEKKEEHQQSEMADLQEARLARIEGFAAKYSHDMGHLGRFVCDVAQYLREASRRGLP
jgi:hypothetical protein